MNVYRCPKGHLYGIAGRGEDLSRGIERQGTTWECPQCKGEKAIKAAEKAAKERP